MKTMKNFLSMAALALMGAMMTGCSSEDNFTAQPQQPENKSKVVTLTTTIGFDASAGTRALTETGVKTFAEGDQIAVIYKNASDETIKTVSTISSGAGTKTATFTVALTNPDNTKAIRYIYPAAMAKATIATNATIDDDGTVDFTKLNSQTGSLTTLGNNLDLCTLDAANWTSGTLPTGTLENKLAILAITLKNSDGSSDITSSITSLTVGDGTNTYAVTRETGAGPIYVAIRPTSDATIDITATSGGKGYYKTLATKTYAASNGYSVSWKMTQGANLSKLTAAYTAQNGDKLTGTLGSNVKISIADGATVTLDGLSINASGSWTSGDYAGITCLGDAIIILSGTNTVKGFYQDYPGIQAAAGKTLTINGTGSLTASSNGYSAGIGGGSGVACGNIEIQGGTITANGGNRGAGIGGAYNASWGNITISGGTVNATGGDSGAGIGGGKRFTANVSCGNITISGGTVHATGGADAAGIGGGRGNNNTYKSNCGTIKITTGVTEVTATKGNSNAQSIGAGRYGTCGTVTIEAGANVTQN